MTLRRFDDEWFIGYRHNLLDTSPFAFSERRNHIVHNIIHSARLGGGVDRRIDHELRRLSPRHAGAVRAHMQLFRACLLATGLVPADKLVNVAVQIEWFWYNTAFTAFYRDHLAHVMKVAAVGLSLFRDRDGPLADGSMPLLDSVARGLANCSLGSPAIRAAARRCGNAPERLEDPEFWEAAVIETIRLAGLLHDMAHPAIIASKMSRIAAPVRPLAPFEPTEKILSAQSVAAFGHRLLAAPFNRGELPDSRGLSPDDAEACAEVFTHSHSLRAGYAIIRLAEDADRIWQLGPFDAFVLEWTALAVSLHDYGRIWSAPSSDAPEDEPLRRWLDGDAVNVESLRPCFARDPVSYILALADQIQEFGRVLGPSDAHIESDVVSTSVRYPCRAVTLSVGRAPGDGASLIFELGPDDGTCFGATSYDYELIKGYKDTSSQAIFGDARGEGGWLDHRGLLGGIEVQVTRAPARAPADDRAAARSEEPVRLFYSFADEDEPFRKALETHLSTLKWQGLVSDWHHRQIVAGEDWKTAVDKHLEAADIVLLLVSVDFVASEYCWGVELERALARHASGAARVIPILVRSADVANAPFAHLEVLPKNRMPVREWADLDRAWTEVAKEIRRIVEEIRR